MPESTSSVWRVMRFEAADGRYVEVASPIAKPEQIPVPSGYRFVSSTPMVPQAELDALRALCAEAARQMTNGDLAWDAAMAQRLEEAARA